jgi:hypothetical protein
MPFRAVERVDAGGGVVRFQTVTFFPNSLEFGNTGGVPSGGTIALLGPGNTTTGVRVPADQRIMGASIQVNVIDALRTFNLSIRVNGIQQDTVPLGLSLLGAQNVALNIPLLATDVVTLFLVRTSGTQASTFTQMRAQLLVG